MATWRDHAKTVRRCSMPRPWTTSEPSGAVAPDGPGSLGGRRPGPGRVLNAFRAADRFEPGTNLRAWLRTILTNLARNRRRDRSGPASGSTRTKSRARLMHGRAGRLTEQQLLSDVIGPSLRAALEAMPKTLRDDLAPRRRGNELCGHGAAAAHPDWDRDVADLEGPPSAPRAPGGTRSPRSRGMKVAR